MRTVNGRPRSVWPMKPVNYSPSPFEVDKQAPRNGKLEIMVLLSEEGWSHTCLGNERRSANNNAGVGRGGVFNALRSKDVYIRREVMRAWHVVRRELARWADDDSTFEPQSYVLVGSPGVGKSFGCGSYLLHELLRYDAARVPVVAYFVRGSAYLFHKTGNMAKRVVFYKKANDAMSAMDKMANVRQEMLLRRKEAEGVKDAERKCRAKFGFIIFDAGGECQPEVELPTSEWGCAVLSSPNKSNCEEWVDQKGALHIFISCYTTREVKALFAWQQWCRCETSERYQSCGAEVEQRWSVVERRIEEVGPLPRYVFDDKKYRVRCNDVSVALSYFCAEDMARYMSILLCRILWTEDSSTDKIIKLVRVASVLVDDCLNSFISEAIGAKLKTLVVNHFFRRSYLAKTLNTPGLVAEVLEKFGSCAFMYESVVDKVVEKMKCLRSASPGHVRESVLSRLRAASRCAQHHQVNCLQDW
ncbi:hypothetical protein, conserved in T. vivax [Trypanosoma vivax Y486]|uniref:Retrotransposon hot spot (RHS) protein n=1 Tax=Trypanosoma vivax (strain Y486) TaxID=1055687 RepID=F9WNR6_TRYVY|nr:hypothetical protein, conserved in T. vivax [Trypanosoma vivax Y486]|eukprot:CCD19187.1 hypothetical protein, conserved in T. vivax [Trypanosoma vivax Y486]